MLRSITLLGSLYLKYQKHIEIVFPRIRHNNQNPLRWSREHKDEYTVIKMEKGFEQNFHKRTYYLP